jgi:hypothetical protein
MGEREEKNMDWGNSGFFSIRQKCTTVFLALLLVCFVGAFAGCGGGGDESEETPANNTNPGTTPTTDSEEESTTSAWYSFDVSTLEDDYDASDYTVPSSGIVEITLNDSSISIPASADGATAAGSVLTISSAGTYRVAGNLDDGRIIVDTEDEAVVRLIFNNVTIACSDSAPVFVENAERTAIILAAGSTNTLSDTSNYAYDGDEDEPNATLHSKDYLTIGGSGSLTVNGNYNDGITSKDGLIINSGTITVSAPDDGIRGKDYLVVKDGTLDITTTDTGDGLLSDEDDDADKGYILIEKGSFTINAAEDAIQAETYVVVNAGTFDLESGGGYTATLAFNDDSKKGIKGVVGVLIEGGHFTIDAADDAVHSNDFVVVDYGDFNIDSGDDGMHADLLAYIYDGGFDIWNSYEGIEGAVITIEDGEFEIHSDDDGLNCAGGADGSGFGGSRDGGMASITDMDYLLTINDGYLAVYAQGDGLDSNGDIEMTGGTVLVHGPTGGDNGSLDCGEQGEILINGGFLIASGSSGMVESPGNASEQNWVTLKFSSSKSDDTLFHIQNSSLTEIVTFQPSKTYQSIVFSSPDLASGDSYSVYFGGYYTGGSESDGLYEEGTYSGGTEDSDLAFSL